ncbi:MAG TPA: 4-hydroxy-3-methylbut-2-enyl diphosphate reductase [Candidatus Hydrogenedentes bacterium]|nr:4-hydroxy-3-methylbut-2-enyl diphosphate reductase [Candidatus Hydrogenedentota bacterium]
MRLIVASPRGFCAGVDRAIRCVERALDRFGPPVYVLNHIVHNAHVVEELRERGAVFIRSLEEVPPGSVLLFSAHGVGPDRWAQARERGLRVIDATCPLVEKVHNEARRFAEKGYEIILIGEAGHDETIGTMGWVEKDRVHLVQTPEDAERVTVTDPRRVAYITQTTLSVEDCARVIAVLKRRFPAIQGPPREDICYATTNRQTAVLSLAPEADLVLVVGDRESANSTRLRDIARSRGIHAELISDVSKLDPAWLEGVETVLVTSGASVPERLVDGLRAWFVGRYPGCVVEERVIREEDMEFRLPREIA